ncbi:MAG TPA: DUF1559 domain-containing protein [Candidatus Paceibacterota bacterium]|nr:DUF1559 domain-containing protein [Candidatus Paceibacterota bacterium]
MLFQAHTLLSKARQLMSGFTLVELLVVIAVIGVLSSLLLPTMIQAKNQAQSAACKNNLRQLGLALNIYIDEHEQYPGGVAVFNGTFLEPPGTTSGRGLVRLAVLVQPDIVSRNRDGAPEGLRMTSRRTVFHCPSKGKAKTLIGGLDLIPDQTKSGTSFSIPPITIYPYGYGYNALGTLQRPPVMTPLGLGPVEAQGITMRVKASTIQHPSEMIAIADAVTDSLEHICPYRVGGFRLLDGIGSVHRGGANAAFCDGHVEYAKQAKWTEAAEIIRQRWNNDHEAHKETW